VVPHRYPKKYSCCYLIKVEKGLEQFWKTNLIISSIQ